MPAVRMFLNGVYCILRYTEAIKEIVAFSLPLVTRIHSLTVPPFLASMEGTRCSPNAFRLAEKRFQNTVLPRHELLSDVIDFRALDEIDLEKRGVTLRSSEPSSRNFAFLDPQDPLNRFKIFGLTSHEGRR